MILLFDMDIIEMRELKMTNNNKTIFMRRIILLLFVLSCAFSSIAQNQASSKINNDSVSSYIATLVEDIDMRLFEYEKRDRYKFYPTENIYNFLKLDTQTGRIEQVQWSLDINKEGSVPINNEDLSWISGSLFELYPTQNMYQFLLLDKTTGRVWHVQWGMGDTKRWIRRIN